nr:MAG TPA: hypothetical protein [Caudoviricetes sp.]
MLSSRTESKKKNLTYSPEANVSGFNNQNYFTASLRVKCNSLR